MVPEPRGLLPSLRRGFARLAVWRRRERSLADRLIGVLLLPVLVAQTVGNICRAALAALDKHEA